MGAKKGKRARCSTKADVMDLQNAPPETVQKPSDRPPTDCFPDPGITPIPKRKSKRLRECRLADSAIKSVLGDRTNFPGVTSTPVVEDETDVCGKGEMSPPPLFDLDFDVRSRVSPDGSDDERVERRVQSPELSVRDVRSTYGGRRKRSSVCGGDSDHDSDAKPEAEPFLWDSPKKATPKKRKRTAKKKQCTEWPENDEWAQKMAEEFERIDQYELVYE